MMNEQDELAMRELYANFSDRELLIRHAIMLHELRDGDRPPCNRLKRLTGNGKLGYLHYQFGWLGLLTIAVFGRDVIMPLLKFLLAAL